MRFLGQTENGIYDECEGINADTLHQFYGVSDPRPPPRRPGQSGAGHPAEEGASDEDCDNRLDDAIASSQQHHVRHPAVSVPQQDCPLRTQFDRDLFYTSLDIIKRENRIPQDFGLHEEYEAMEYLRHGRRRKEMAVPLPHGIWYPRTLLWCQALDLLVRIPLLTQTLDID